MTQRTTFTKMTSRIAGVLGVTAALAIAGCGGSGGSDSTGTSAAPEPAAPAAAEAESPTTATPAAKTKDGKEITVTGTEYRFDMPKVVVKAGTPVTFKLENKGNIIHDLVFPKLNKRTEVINPGESGTVTVTFPKKGTYYYLCSIPNHAVSGMSGEFVVR